MVRGQTILINPQLISSVIGVPVLPVSGVPFPEKAPNIEFLHDFFGTGQVPLPDQHRFLCSYAPILSKGCCHKPLASSSAEWAYPQEGHPSLRHHDADSIFPVQAHLAHYAQGSRWEEHESVVWVSDHSNLPWGRARYFRLGAPLTNPKSSWHSDSHEV
jgi:hypothetical protein